MPKWYKFDTAEVEALKEILEDDVQTTESYEAYLDVEGHGCFVAGMAEVDGQQVLMIDGVDVQERVIDAVGRRSLGQGILDKLQEGGETEHD